jgi:FAD/FMN-containing dehydrogenase
MEELQKMKKEKKAEARRAALLDLGLEAEEAEESLASYEELDDATFDLILAAVKKMEDKKVVKKEEEETDADPKKGLKAEEVEETTEAETEEVAEEAAEAALEEVETTEATLVDASNETDEIEATRASVAEWLQNNVLSK